MLCVARLSRAIRIGSSGCCCNCSSGIVRIIDLSLCQLGKDCTVLLRHEGCELYRGLLRITCGRADGYTLMDVTVKTDRLIVTGTGCNGILQGRCKGFLQEGTDVVVQEDRAKVQHILLNDSISGQLALSNLHRLEGRCDLLSDLGINVTPYGSLDSMVIEDPSGQIGHRLEIDLGKKRMLLYKVLIHVLNDGHRHDLIIQETSIDLLRVALLAGLDDLLIVSLFRSSQLTEAPLCKDVPVTIGRLKVSLDGGSNGLTELVKCSLDDLRCGVFSVECSLQSSCCICNHRIRFKHFLSSL